MPRSPSRSSYHSVGEFELINVIKRTISHRDHVLPEGIGDDAALIRKPSHCDWLVSSDLLIEGVHFNQKFCSHKNIGYRAGAVNVSDIAAMGGIPRYLLTSIALPRSDQLTEIRDLYRGLHAVCKSHNIRLIGGDTSASPSTLFLSLTIIGTIRSGRALGRNGARVGDLIYVSGTLGDSGAGLAILQNHDDRHTKTLPMAVTKFLIKRHLYPNPQVQLGELLAANRLASAAIDLSDGLSGDLRHICLASKVGATVDLTKLPLSRQNQIYAKHINKSIEYLALHSGEDYELLFTVPKSKQAQLERLVAEADHRITHIGTIESRRNNLQVRYADGSRAPMPQDSYDHFKTSRH